MAAMKYLKLFVLILLIITILNALTDCLAGKYFLCSGKFLAALFLLVALQSIHKDTGNE